MTHEEPKFEKMINWPVEKPQGNFMSLRPWLLERAQYEIVIERKLTFPDLGNNNDYGPDLRDIEEQAEGRWAAVRIDELADKSYSHYFFQLERDAMAFKLRWT